MALLTGITHPRPFIHKLYCVHLALLISICIQFHKAAPKGLRFLPAVMPKQRPLTYRFPNFCGRDLCFCPFENQHSIGFKHTHTLFETVMKHFGPVIVKSVIFFSQPCVFSNLSKMGWIPNNKGKRIVIKRKIRKITLNIWSNNARSLGLTVSRFPNTIQFFGSFVRIYGGRMVFIKPDCPTATGNIKDFLVHLIPPNNPQTPSDPAAPRPPSTSDRHPRRCASGSLCPCHPGP